MKTLQDFFKKAGAVSGEIENYGKGEQSHGNFYTIEGKWNSQESEEDRHQRADGRTADLTLGNFRIFDMRREKNVSAHPV